MPPLQFLGQFHNQSELLFGSLVEVIPMRIFKPWIHAQLFIPSIQGRIDPFVFFIIRYGAKSLLRQKIGYRPDAFVIARGIDDALEIFPDFSP